MGNWDVSKPNKDGEPCEDCISRADAEALFRNAREELHKSAIRNEQNGHPIKDLPTRDLMLLNAEQMIHLLPPVTPKPKTGHWEWVQYDYNPKLGDWHCSECRCVVVECVNKEEEGGIPLYRYCPQCGARMVEPQESEGSDADSD